MTYRRDIDGLRAISVIAVILFHLGWTGCAGGFIGVDVFFVISGYLISGILLDAFAGQKFGLGWFYERRIRRIVPALLVVVAFCLIAGFVLLFPGDFKTMSWSAISAIFAASNIFFLNNTGYFDAKAELMPLLHTWSLGVEEQFYLVWPLLLGGLFHLTRGDKRRLAFSILAIIIVSFAFNIWQVGNTPKAAFYLPFSRAWELALGGLMTLARPFGASRHQRWLSELAPMLGFGLILWGCVALSATDPFPGFGALYPALGAALILYPSSARTSTARLLGSAPFVFVGKISYSLYLWHWPLIAFWRIYSNSIEISPLARIVIALSAVLLAWASYRWVEQPARKIAIPRIRVFASAAGSSAILSALLALVIVTDGVQSRIPPAAREIGDKTVMWDWPCPQIVDLNIARFDNPTLKAASCSFGAPWQTAHRHALLWGDSNSEHLLPLLDLVGKDEDIAFVVVNPCPAILRKNGVERDWPNDPGYAKRCGQQRASVIEMLNAHREIGLVILSSRWSNLSTELYRNDAGKKDADGVKLLREGFDDLLPQIKDGRRVILINDIPGIPVTDPAACALASVGLPRMKCKSDLGKIAWETLHTFQRPAHDQLRDVGKRYPEITVYSPEDYLCGDGRCLMFLDGEFLYRDDVHFRRNLSARTAAKLIRRLRLRELLTEQSPNLQNTSAVQPPLDSYETPH